MSLDKARNLIRWSLGAALLLAIATAPGAQDVDMRELGHSTADFLTRIIAVVLYVSSILSAGIHRYVGALPPGREPPGWVHFMEGVLDAMSINGRAPRRSGDSTSEANGTTVRR